MFYNKFLFVNYNLDYLVVLLLITIILITRLNIKNMISLKTVGPKSLMVSTLECEANVLCSIYSSGDLIKVHNVNRWSL